MEKLWIDVREKEIERKIERESVYVCERGENKEGRGERAETVGKERKRRKREKRSREKKVRECVSD